ncbi:hypothetical protein JYU34_019578 [Plutella xylostella]|uniref:PPM-type phosphatase domain-containing protein n=1 Tax=Plutella xylostella TaxID=51655 RepID=A0ABQ7Q0W7_PLUXY|nr:hypothetical protein JYU34_019578 [Plutella xylostella]
MIARPWTDDLQKCPHTCVGQYISRIGMNSENDDYLCFYGQLEDSSPCLYGVFEPHNGVEAARFIMQRMAVEILFGQITAESSDEEIRDILRNAFVAVEKAYIENYDGMIAERTSLQYSLQTLSESQGPKSRDSILARLKEIDQQLSAGATAVVALVHNSKLFVANVGEARALLCRTDENSVLRVVQLSVDHSLKNEDELLRLRQLGLDIKKLRNAQYLGNQSGTRCLGNYLVKGLYGAFPTLRGAAAEPVRAAAELAPPVPLSSQDRFLVLVSSGVYKRIQEVKGNSEQTNKHLAQIIVENFRKQTDFKKLSQSVLTEIEDEFNTYCMNNNLTPKPTHMGLLIRNFNFPLPNQKETLTQSEKNQVTKQNAVRFNPIVQSKSTTLLNESDSLDDEVCTESSQEKSEIDNGNRRADPNRRIKGYVDFSCYYENVEKARKNGTLPSFIK